MTQSIRNATDWALRRAQGGTIQDSMGNTLLSGPGAILAQDILRDVQGVADSPAKQTLLDGLREAVEYVRAHGGAVVDAPTFPTWAAYTAVVGTPPPAPADPVAFFAPPAPPVPAPVDPIALVAADPTAPAWLPDVLRAVMPVDQDGRPGPAAPLHAVTDLLADVDDHESRLRTLESRRRTSGGWWSRLTQPRDAR